MGAAIRETAAAASALFAYLTTVLPRVRRELRELGPLPEEKAKNAEAVAVFATLAPRSRRAAVVRAIVTLQVAIDLRDEIEEAGVDVDPAGAVRIAKLDASRREEVAALPSHRAVGPLLEQAVERCEQGQRRTHAAADGQVGALRTWAEDLDAPAGYRWWEVAAGAGSSVGAHALIAAASDPATTAETAARIDAAYHPAIGALTVLLDDLVDREQDRVAGQHNYLAYYGNAEEAGDRLTAIGSDALGLLAHLPHSRRHRAILAGVAAFYLGAPEAEGEYGEEIRGRLLQTLGPGTRLLSAFMRARPG